MKKEKERQIDVRRGFGSLYSALLFSMLVALIFALLLYFMVNLTATASVNKRYTTDEKRAEREKQYAEDLQKYVTENELSSEDTEQIARWVRNNKYLYVMIYKDDQLIIDSDTAGKEEGTQKPDTEGGTGGTEGGSGGTEGGSGDTEGGSGDTEGGSGDTEGGSGDTEGGSGDTEGGTGDTDGGTGGADDKDDDKNNGGGGSSTLPSLPGFSGGVTVDFPTREELIKYANERGSVPITVSDGALLASMVDFSEYFYYDIINIMSLALAAIAFVLVVLLYFRGVTGRIKKLGAEITRVAEGEMDRHIFAEGRDEISRLGADVENMRSTIVLNLEKERAALDANAELITAMSHDIRTPLTVLLGYIDMMKLGADEETMREYVRASEKTALRLKQMSDDMFNYFLVFGGEGVKIALEKYDAATLFDQMLAEYLLLITEQGYTIETNLGDGERLASLFVRTDPAQLMRIAENIFSNIFKYADKERPVSINVDTFGTEDGGEGKIRLTVTNYILEGGHAEHNGIGIRSCTKIAAALGLGFSATRTGDRYTVSLEIPTLTADENKED